MLSHVCLVSDHLVVVWNAPAPNLNTRIGLGWITNEFHLQAQLKISIDLLRRKEFIVRNILFETSAYYGTVLNPEIVEIALPSVKSKMETVLISVRPHPLNESTTKIHTTLNKTKLLNTLFFIFGLLTITRTIQDF
jgi:hypothetical protein